MECQIFFVFQHWNPEVSLGLLGNGNEEQKVGITFRHFGNISYFLRKKDDLTSLHVALHGDTGHL